MTRKNLFYYCVVNQCYCVVCAIVNLSICRMDIQGIQIQFVIRHCFTPMEIPTDCTLHMGIPTKYICRYIPETMETVLLHPDTIHGIHYIQVYQRNVFVGIYQRPWELFPFTLALFTMFITYEYTDGICLSVYSKDHENCSLLNAMIINDLLTVHFFTDGIKSHR